MSTPSQWEQVLFIHVISANYIASTWKKADAAKPVLPTDIDHWNENGSLTRTYSARKLKKLFSIKSLIAMIIILIVGRATTRKIFDLILCYLVVQCIA